MSFKTTSIGIVAVCLAFSVSAQEQSSMKQQAKEDWQEIRETASEVKDATVNWGKSVGKKAKELGLEAADVAKDLGGKARAKANELTEKAHQAAQEDETAQQAKKDKPGKRFFY